VILTKNNSAIFLKQLKQRARQLKNETYALLLAFRHPETPWYAKVVVGLVLFNAFSPIDLIPDFIPVLGYLDDIILIPAGIALSIKLIPPEVMAECRVKALEQGSGTKPKRWLAGGALVVAVWLVLVVLLVLLVRGLID
jgi:uncharacterized membrane protein YkvA (DUF1232 family)